MDNILRKSLSKLNIINWTDFYSWKRDYDNADLIEMKKKIDEYIMIDEEIDRRGGWDYSAAAAA